MTAESALSTTTRNIVPITSSRRWRAPPVPEPLRQTPELAFALAIFASMGRKQRRKARLALLSREDDTARRLLRLMDA